MTSLTNISSGNRLVHLEDVHFHLYIHSDRLVHHVYRACTLVAVALEAVARAASLAEVVGESRVATPAALDLEGDCQAQRGRMVVVDHVHNRLADVHSHRRFLVGGCQHS